MSINSITSGAAFVRFTDASRLQEKSLAFGPGPRPIGLNSSTVLNPLAQRKGEPAPFTAKQNTDALKSVSTNRQGLKQAAETYGIRNDVMGAVWFENQRRLSPDDLKSTNDLRKKVVDGGAPTTLETNSLQGSGPKIGLARLTLDRVDDLLRDGAIKLPFNLQTVNPAGKKGAQASLAINDASFYNRLSVDDKFAVAASLATDKRFAPALVAADLKSLLKQYVDKGGDPAAANAKSMTQFFVATQLAERGPYVGSDRPTTKKFENGTSVINFAGYDAVKNATHIRNALNGNVSASVKPGYFQ
jgi:hypothetical protein